MFSCMPTKSVTCHYISVRHKVIKYVKASPEDANCRRNMYMGVKNPITSSKCIFFRPKNICIKYFIKIEKFPPLKEIDGFFQEPII